MICDKPLTTNLADAVKLVQLAASKQRLLGVTFNYTGYPMIRHAKQLVADGLIGNLRVVQVEYPQGWLSTALEKSGQKQASWRTDPKQAGAGALGDIGSHAFQLAEFVTGAQVAGSRRRRVGAGSGPRDRRQRQRAAALRQWRAR